MIKNTRPDHIVALCALRIGRLKSRLILIPMIGFYACIDALGQAVGAVARIGGGVLYLADEEFDRFRYMCASEWNAVCRTLAGTIEPDDENP